MNFLEKKEAYLVAGFCVLAIWLVGAKQTLDVLEVKKNGIYRTAEVIANPIARKGMFSVAIMIDGNRHVISIPKEKAEEIIFKQMDTLGVLYSPELNVATLPNPGNNYSFWVGTILLGIPIWFWYIYFRKRKEEGRLITQQGKRYGYAQHSRRL
jgi:protein-S-isoprenylcysteine O-methyltransferase Ste14